MSESRKFQVVSKGDNAIRAGQRAQGEALKARHDSLAAAQAAALEQTPRSPKHEARSRAERIRKGMRELARMWEEWQAEVIAAYQARDWRALDYDSWQSYLDDDSGRSASESRSTRAGRSSPR